MVIRSSNDASGSQLQAFSPLWHRRQQIDLRGTVITRIDLLCASIQIEIAEGARLIRNRTVCVAGRDRMVIRLIRLDIITHRSSHNRRQNPSRAGLDRFTGYGSAAPKSNWYGNFPGNKRSRRFMIEENAATGE